MKSLKLAVVAISLIGVLGVGNAMALDTATINVSATVLGTCSFNPDTYTLAFSTTIDPTTTGDETANVELEFYCTTGTNWTLEDPSSLTLSMASGVNNLAYSVAAAATTGSGSGGATPVKVMLTGTIAEAAKQAAVAGAYIDQFTLDINP
jgi:hypothetical protein